MQRYLDKFKNYLAVERNYSAHTIKNYLADLNEFFRTLSQTEDITAVNYLTVRKFLGFLHSRKIAKRSVARKLSSLRTFFRFLYKDGYIKNNPVANISTTKLDSNLPIF